MEGDDEITEVGVELFLGNKLTKSENLWKDVIKEMDLNDDGKIDLDEFKAMMLKINEIAPTMTKN